MYFPEGQNAGLVTSFRMPLCPSLFLLLKCCCTESGPLWGSWALKVAAVTLLRHAHVRLLNLPDSLTNPFQSSKPQPPNALWQEGRQSYTGMLHPIYPWPGLISPNPCVSADLSWADVTEATELEQEVVAGKGHLCIGNAAVVTFRDQRGIDGYGFWAGEVTSTALNIDHLHELWSRKSPEPSQFRKSPVSTQRRQKEKWPTSPIAAQFNTWIQTMWNTEWYNKPEANLLSGHINYLL